jgi:membrane protease YdiL (CAAX protease family)
VVEPEDKPSTTALVVSALVFYALMAVIGTLVLGASGQDPTVLIFGDGTRVGIDTLWGAGAGLGVVGLTWFLRNLKAVVELNEEFRDTLGSPSSAAIAILAVSSAIGEELLFRGALQETIGFWWTVCIFGLMHGGFSRKFRVWAIFATLAGILLGWLAEMTGNLLAPMLCHLTVNYFNLHLVCKPLKGGGGAP